MGLIIKTNEVVKYNPDKNTNKIVIPEGVTSIGYKAFENCRNLTSITIPDSVTNIGNSAFSECRKLTSITIPNGVTSIGNNAFSWCVNLKEVHIKSIGAWLKIKFKDYDSNPLCYGASLFVNGVKVEGNLIIPEGTETIGDYAFRGCNNLTSVTIPDSVTSIDENAFCWCKNLKEVHINSIGAWLKIKFKNRFSNPLHNGASLFVNGVKVEGNLIIPEGTDTIGDYAFHGCNNLTSVTIPDGVKVIGDYTFYECENLTSVTIPDSVTSIGNSAFSYCVNLISINIPDSVKSIGNYAFDRCENLKKVHINSIEAWLKIKLKDYDSNPLCYGASLFVNGVKVEGNLIIPNGVKAINNYAFFGCDNLTSITIPDSVTKIGGCAFSDCINLISITIPESVKTIGLGAFSECKKLTSIILPNSVKEIRSDAFYECKNLTSITIPDSVTKIGKHVFYRCKYLVDITYSDIYNLSCILADLLDSTVSFDGNPKNDTPLCPMITLNDGKLSLEEKNAVLPILEEKCKKDNSLYIAYAALATDNKLKDLLKNLPIWSKGKKADKKIAMYIKGGIFLNDSLTALKYADSIGKLDHYAKIRNKDEDELRDQIMSDFGLDDNGYISWNVGDRVITAKLENDLKFSLYDEAGKSLKSISKKTEEGKNAADAFAALKNDVKSVAKIRNDRLLANFLSGMERETESWRSAWMKNPLMKVLGRLVVWSQNTDTFTLHDDGLLYKSDGTEYQLNDCPVKVAHPMEMKNKDLELWRKYFADNGLKQPFEQIWEPVIRKEDITDTRYDNCTIPLYMLMNKGKHGIIMKGQSELQLTDCSADIELVEQHSDWINNQYKITYFKLNKYSRASNHIISILDKGTVEGRVRNDDVTVSMYLDRFTLPQIMKFIDIAGENNCSNVMPVLLEYKETHFTDYDPMDEFTLDI